MLKYPDGQEIRVGDLVERNSSSGTAAKKGAQAIVESLDYQYVRVRWDESDLRWNDQSHGGYFTDYFDLVARQGTPALDTPALDKSKVEGECACPREVWLFTGCKCGAIMPYKPKP